MESNIDSTSKLSMIEKLKSPKVLISIASGIVLFVVAYFMINSAIWASRLATESTTSLSSNELGTALYLIEVDSKPESNISFDSEDVIEENGNFYVSTNDMIMGSNAFVYNITNQDHSRVDSVIIDNQYLPISLTTSQRTDSNGSTIKFQIETDPGNRFVFMDYDTILSSGTIEILFDPEAVLEDYEPNTTPSFETTEVIQVSNSSGNQINTTEDMSFNFPVASIHISDPSNSYTSRTGSGYTIRGTGARGTRVSFSGAASGSLTIGYGGSFSKWVSVSEFGSNSYYLSSSKDGYVNDFTEVTIYREMTESERISEYKNSCSQYSAEYVRQNQNYLTGDRVRLWGRTVEYFSAGQLHLVNGNDHWIADLSGFDQIPSLVGLSCYCWGEVTSRSQSFRTSGGRNVVAPVLEAVYFEVSY